MSKYLTCINNAPFIQVNGAFSDDSCDLTVGERYVAVWTPEHERQAGMVRVIDDSGGAYLYPASYFEEDE